MSTAPPPYKRTSDALACIASGPDSTAWSFVVESHAPIVSAICQRICGHGSLADDACQETWLLLPRIACQFKQLADVQEDEALATAWIRRIAANVALTLLRRQRRAVARDGKASAPSGASPSDASHDVEALHLALARLPDRARQPLILMYFGGLDYSSLAASIGCSIPAARVRVHRAIERLRRSLPNDASPSYSLIAGAAALQSPQTLLPAQLSSWLALSHSTVQPTIAASTILGTSTLVKITAASLMAIAIACPAMLVTVSQHVHAAEAAPGESDNMRTLLSKVAQLEHRQEELESVAEAAEGVLNAENSRELAVNATKFLPQMLPDGHPAPAKSSHDRFDSDELTILRTNLQRLEQQLLARNEPAPASANPEPSREALEAEIALKSGVLPAMVQFQAGDYIDQSGNGIGQYGLFPELCGGVTLKNGQRIRLELLAPAFSTGEPVVAGYHFRIYLPAGPNVALTSNPDGSRPLLEKTKDAEAIDLQSHVWRCYAWPASGTGLEFVINQTGMDYVRQYAGSPPSWNAFNMTGTWKDFHPSPDWTVIRNHQFKGSTVPERNHDPAKGF